MPIYMVQFRYTTEAQAALVRRPQNREEAVRPIVEQLGGRLLHFWFSLGEYDTAIFIEMTDEIHIRAFAMAFVTAGVATEYNVTTLMTMQQALEAMRLAGGIGYRAPEIYYTS